MYYGLLFRMYIGVQRKIGHLNGAPDIKDPSHLD